MPHDVQHCAECTRPIGPRDRMFTAGYADDTDHLTPVVACCSAACLIALSHRRRLTTCGEHPVFRMPS